MGSNRIEVTWISLLLLFLGASSLHLACTAERLFPSRMTHGWRLPRNCPNSLLKKNPLLCRVLYSNLVLLNVFCWIIRIHSSVFIVNCLSGWLSFRQVKYLEGSSVYVRLSDARRADELPAPNVRIITENGSMMAHFFVITSLDKQQRLGRTGHLL